MVSAMLGGNGASRSVVRLCLAGRCQPLMGEKLFHEYCDLFGRSILDRSPLNRGERKELIEAFLSVCDWVPIAYLWRPNLPDEGDNHVVELAVAGMAGAIMAVVMAAATAAVMAVAMTAAMAAILVAAVVVRAAAAQ